MAPELRAIEHAEYMAKSAEHLLQALNDYATACGEDGQEHDPDEVCGAEENVGEATRHLRSMIYEFRKRAAKVPNAVLSGAAPQQPKRHADEPRPPRTRG